VFGAVEFCQTCLGCTVAARAGGSWELISDVGPPGLASEVDRSNLSKGLAEARTEDGTTKSLRISETSPPPTKRPAILQRGDSPREFDSEDRTECSIKEASPPFP
jgi:hypothetical protein